MLIASWHILLELAPWLLLGMVIAGALHGLLPRGFLRRHLRGSAGILRAVALGVPLPLCSCSVIPAGIGLKEDGASNGASVGFLISTPQTGVDSILVSASFLGWPFALFKVLSAAITGIVGGFVTQSLSEEPEPPTKSESAKTGPRPSAKEMVQHALSIVQSIWFWLVFGVVLSAAIEVYAPAVGLESIGELGQLGAILAVLLVSVPLYVCATASVPIAAALVAGGLPTGAALVFLMAGPATNVATVGAVHRTFGTRILAVYLSTIIVGSVAFGLAFDAWVGTGAVLQGTIHTHESPLATISAVVLILLLTYFAFADLKARFARDSGHAHSTGPRLELAVSGMTCGGCVQKVENALRNEQGVDAVEVTLEPGSAVVYGQTDKERLIKAIEDVGFTAE